MPPSTLSDSSYKTETLAFLFLDLEHSSQRIATLGAEQYRHALEEAHRAIANIIAKNPNIMLNPGDTQVAGYSTPKVAVSTAKEILLTLSNHHDQRVAATRVRIGLHFGQVRRLADGFMGLDLHRAARICSVGHYGQILLSTQIVEQLGEETSEFKLIDLGRHRLKDLGEPQRLFQLVVEGVENDFPPPRSLEAFPTNLPIQLTPFIGRESEVARVSELVRGSALGESYSGSARELVGGDDAGQTIRDDDLRAGGTRLVTLVGPGGIGKTRLALQAAASLIEEFEDGVYFVGLASIQDPDYVLSAVAQAIGVSETGGSLFDAVINFLGAKRLLLVLDNFEHVISAAPVIDSLLDQAPGLRVLATSRTHLKIKEEQEYSVEPFSVPQLDRLPSIDELARFDSISLFIDRARAVNPHFSLTTTNAKAVAGICARVDGIALAIELAAARTKLFTPQALLTRLDKQLPVLKGSHRDVSSRQMTLKNTIEWSYNLLHDNEKTLLNRLAIFTGGFNIEATHEICSIESERKAETLLTSLVESNLVQALENEPHRQQRFSLLSLIAEFAYNQLKNNDEVDSVRNRHAAYFLRFAETSADAWYRSGANFGVERMQRDDANIRAALDWTITQNQHETGLRLIAACWIFWTINNPLAQVKPKIENVVNIAMRDHSIGRDLLAGGLLAIAGMHYRLFDYEQVERYAREVTAAPEGVSLRKQTVAWYLIGLAASDGSDDLGSARRALTRAAKLADMSSSAVISHWVKIQLARGQLMRKKYSEARKLFGELIWRLRESDDTYSLATVLGSMGDLEVAEHRPRHALSAYLEGLDTAETNHLIQLIPDLLVAAAAVLEQQGDSTRAGQVLSQTELIGREQGLTVYDQKIKDRTLNSLHDHLSTGEFETAWNRGQRLSLAETIELIRDGEREIIRSS